MKSQKILSYIPLLCISGLSLLFLGAQNPPPTPPSAPALVPAPPSHGRAIVPTNAEPAKPHALVWDATEKTYHPELGEQNAPFSFWVTNTSNVDVQIAEVAPSCGCTVANYPKPWNLKPGESGEVKASMSLAGKSGTQVKILTVRSSGGAPQVLTVTVPIPVDTNAERRKRNMEAAAKDRQAVFKGDCAACHVEPLKEKKGEHLFVAGCNICHEPPTGHRAAIVPDLKKLPFPTDKEYWKKMISDGKPGSLMPGFAKAHGGPLTDEEIESLADYAVQTFKFDPANSVKKTN